MKKKNLLALSILTATLGLGTVQLTSCGNNEIVEEETKYNVTVSSSEEYKVIGLKSDLKYKENEAVQFSIEVLTEGKYVKSVKVNGEILEPHENSYMYVMGKEDISIEIELAAGIAYYRKNATKEGVEAEIEGVVTSIIMNQGNSYIAGFFLADDTDQIYVYTNKEYNVSGISVGNKVVVKGSILNYYKNPTDTFFTFQLANPVLVNNDNETHEYNKAIEKASSVLDIKNIPTTESHVGEIYTANCQINISNPTYGTFSFLSPDETYSLPSYSQYKGTYDWLKEYDGQWKNVSFALFTPKSSGGNTFWRVVPIAVNGDYTQTDDDKIQNYIAEAKGSFNKKFFGKAQAELLSVSKENENIQFSYESTNKEIADVEVKDGKTYLNVKGVSGETGIKITASTIKGTNSFTSEAITITVNATAPELTLTSISEIKKATVTADSEVTIKGVVVGGNYANGNDGQRFNAYYVMDETDSIIVNLDVTEWPEMTLESGMEVYITGVKDVYADANDAVSIRKGVVKYISETKKELPYTPETKAFGELYDTPASSENNLAGKLYYVDVLLTAKENSYSGQLQYYITEVGTEKTKNIYQASKTNVDSYLSEFRDKEIHCLLGIHDAKNGYYRYDIIPGTIELLNK